jgi:cob(I)alamin adenosyltransferase
MSPHKNSSSCCDAIPVAATTSSIVDIEDLHRDAVKHGEKTYIDPASGFTVFTELQHLQRGICCGNQCRHCPYGWCNVPSGVRKEPKVKSGDKEAVALLRQQLLSQVVVDDEGQVKIAKGRGGRHGGTLTKKNVPYTRKGDQGTSQLSTGERRAKDDEAFEVMGTVDELCSVVGVAHAEMMEKGQELYGVLPDYLMDVMSRLFDIGSHVAKPRRIYEDDSDDDDEEEKKFSADGVGGGFHVEHIEDLEVWIDLFTEELPELSSFILPSGTKVSAQLHVARTVCRRAERRCVKLVEAKVCDPNALKYLNRLSDFFFAAARYANFKEGKSDTLYCLPHRGAKQRGFVQVDPKAQAKK